MSLFDDFSSGLLKPGFWDAVTGGLVRTAFPGQLLSLYFANTGRRDATTVAINTNDYPTLAFDLVYGNGANGQPDNGFPITLEYSTDGKTSWQPLAIYSKPEQWTRFILNLPVAARSPSTYIRWDQNNNFSAGTHAWALDNIAFSQDPFQHPTSVDFSNGLNDGIFSDITNGKVDESFVLGRTKSLVFDSNGRRDVTTTAINTQEFKSLQFDLVYGDGVNGQPANGYPVSLEYATEKGGPWKTLQTYTLPGQWTRFHVNLSLQDQDSEAYFRWDQNNNFSAGTHAWALDNIAFNKDFFQHPASVDFSNGLNDGIFGDITNGKVEESFVLGRTKSLVFDSNGRRDVTTTAINTQEFKSLQFDLVYGDGVNGQPANGYPVSLEYATEKGGPWKTLQTYTLPGQWTRFHVNLSLQDQDSEAYFRWDQNDNFSAGTHAWALDDIAFSKEPFQHPTNVDFSNGLNDGLFGNISNAKVADAFAGRSKALTFTGGGARFVDTTAIDTRKYRALEFDLIYGNGSNGGAANAFPISLEYSTNNGTSWTPLKTFVNSGVWNREIVELPIAAQQEATLLRWDQNTSASTGTHVWAVDNIRLKTDTKPPALAGIVTQGNRLQLTFTEPVVYTELTSDRFSVTVGSTTREVTSMTAGFARSEVLLTLSGAQPLSSEQVRLTYADPVGNDSEGVIEDDFGNDLRSIAAPGRLADTFTAAASVTSLAVSYARLNLIGPDDLTGIGHSGANTITGNAGDNLLDGLGGKDQVVGGLGADKFRFSTPLNARTNQDRIIDFNPRQGDKILLENAVFTGLSAVGRLAADAFALGAAKTAGHRILYNPNSGALTYDSNGSAGGAGTIFASLAKGLELSSSSFVVI